MKVYYRKTVFIGCLLLCALLLLANAQPGNAQTPEATPPTPSALMAEPQATALPSQQSPPGVAEVSFVQLGQPVLELRSPLDQESFTFDIPYRWTFTGRESYIEVHYDFSHVDYGPERGPIRVALDVYYNDVLAASLTPVEGRAQTLRVPIPQAAIGDPSQTRHEVRFVYMAGDCQDRSEQSLFLINGDSFFHFEYGLSPLTIDLADFPRPLVQNPFKTETVLIVIPDGYSDADLAAAASVAATVGQRTFNEVLVELVTATAATPERLGDRSAIIVGKPQDNVFLLDLYQRDRLPTTLSQDLASLVGPAGQIIPPDDAVLQEIPSEFSDDHVYLVVTGASDAAVARAAQTLSVLEPRYGFAGDLVLVEDYREVVSDAVQLKDDFRLADLGLADATLYGIDKVSTSVQFYVPRNWRLTDNPTLTLSYVHSSVLQPTASGLGIELNKKLVGSVPIDGAVLGERQVSIRLPKDALHPGTHNRLSFVATMSVEAPECTLPDTELAWIRISETSTLRLPHEEVEDVISLASLREPLVPFASKQDLSDVWFSLPETPTDEELAGLVRVAAWLGNLSDGQGFVPRVSRGAVNDTAQLEGYHVIAFGRPTRNPMIAAVNEQLPQPFVPGEDTLRQEVGNVVYRLPGNFSIGLLQSMPAPWNSGRVMLVATGTTQEGIAWALDTLTDESLYYELDGDLAFIRADRLESFDTGKYLRGALAAGLEAVSAAGEEVTLEVVPTTMPTPTPAGPEGLASLVPMPQAERAASPSEAYLPENTSPPAGVTPLILGLIGLGVAIAVVGVLVSWRKGKSH
jgi:hypothetical protein